MSANVHEAIAEAFHTEYEERAPLHGWETQRRSRVAWADVPEENRTLMVGVVGALLRRGVIEVGPNVPGHEAMPAPFQTETRDASWAAG